MTIYGSILPGAAGIARHAETTNPLTEEAKRRLKIIGWHRTRGENTSLTARRFGLGRSTLQRWLKRYRQLGPLGLNEVSRRPKKLRSPTTVSEVVIRIVQLRRQYPAWSKYKLAKLLEKEGVIVSASTVGRVLKRRNLIDAKASRRRRRAALKPRRRYPKGLKICAPGDIVQMDTKHITLVGGRKIYQFSAIDVLSKRRVLRYYPSLSSRNGAAFLRQCLKEFPFLVRAVQTDNGSEFLKEFEKTCQVLNLPHYFIYPRTPKQNTYVEISHGADEREFYQQGAVSPLPEVMAARLGIWEDTWNNTRPHEALDYLTPNEYLEKYNQGRVPTKNIIILQA